MKALVLAGGFPQIDLIRKLKDRGIVTILADYYEHPVAKDFADRFYRVSTLDIDAIRKLAIYERVDFIITICTDQALLTMAKVSEDLGLPCYINYETARNVTNKSYMKQVFSQNSIPTAKYVAARTLDEFDFSNWSFPLIVKPVDCNSSKGVYRINNKNELIEAFYKAISYSRSNTAIIEEFIEGEELSVDVYVENGRAILLDITTSEKLKNEDKFIIFRTWHPADISEEFRGKIQIIVQKIADSFGIVNSPMLIQMIMGKNDVYVIEFSARTGGGVKHLSIERRTGVDITSTVIDLTLGLKPHLKVGIPETKFMIDEYIYCLPGIFDHIEGISDLKKNNIITDFYIFRWSNSIFEKIENSGDRVGGFTIQGNTLHELQKKHSLVNQTIKVVDISGKDIMRHDLLTDFDKFES